MQEFSRQLPDTVTYIKTCSCDQNYIIKISIANLNKLRPKYKRLHIDKRRLTLSSRCDVVSDVIIMKNIFHA